MTARTLALACGLAGALGLARADEKPPVKVDPKQPAKADAKPAFPALDRADLDRRLAHIAHDAALAGSELWKAEKYAECLRLYQGTLLAVEPLLDHRPKLAAFVKDKLDKGAGLKPTDGAFVLREALDAVQAETATALLPPPKAALWERLGGEKQVRAVVHDFVAAASKDAKLDLTRGGMFKLDDKATARLEEALVELVSEVGRGPLLYTGGDVRKALAGTKITDAEFDALVGHLEAALKKNKVGKDETDELIKIAQLVKPAVVGQ